jgi:predicted nucleotidyltransferase
MKKAILFLCCLVFSLQNFAQPLTFEQIRPAPPAPQNIVDFDGVFESSIAFADVDNDNDQDVLITGQDNFNQTIAKLYVNNGSGNFTLVAGTPFDGVKLGSIVFADVDNDNDQDVLITGRNSSNLPIAKLYTNNGSGSFTLVTGTPFDGVSFSSIAFADVDNDNDQDVLITGENRSNQSIAKLYLNNGSGSFTIATGTPFEGVRNGSVAFADVDNDTDQDVLITGENSFNQSIAKLYVNNGSGSFTLVAGTPFDGVKLGSISFADVDNDTDQDVLITGENSFNQSIAKLYTNNGRGSYTEVTGTPFDGVSVSSIAFSDVDNDFDQDVLITGANNSNQQIAKLYLNNGSESFMLATGTPFDWVRNSSIAFADVDNDNDQDVLITGTNNSNQRIAKLYVNNDSGSFSLVAGKPFYGVYSGSIAFADVDNDTDQDVLITGGNNSNQSIAKLYTNNGSGIYLEVTGTPFEEVDYSSIAFVDVDNDTDQDVLITGRNNSSQMIAKLYTNNGNGGFTEVTGTPFDGVYRSSIAFADVDSDNDQDLLITGINNTGQRIAKLYTNNGSGSFTLVTGTPFDGAYGGSIAFADVDNDNDQDLLITGKNNTSQAITKLYTNNGSGSYTEVTGTPFDRFSSGSIAFADVDNDNDQDLLITGQNNTSMHTAKLYTNNGSGGFTLVTGTPFDGVDNSSIAFADVDNDNDQDLLITGQNNTGQRIAKLYTNNGSGSFTLVTGIPFEGAVGGSSGSIAFADVDNDTDQDVLITGLNNSSLRIAKLYRNLLISPCQNIRETTNISICNSYNWQGMILTTSGTYYDTIPNSAGCDSLMTLNLTIRNESSETFTADECNSYDWQGMTFTTSGTYYDTITNAAGCDSLMTLNLTIHTNDTSITKANDTLTVNQVGAAYQWLNCDSSFSEVSGATSQDFSPSKNGFYACQINLNGCTDTTACTEVVIIGIVGKDISMNYKVYPNPLV